MMKVLIVEDEQVAREALIYSLEQLYSGKFQMFSSDNGLEALNLAQKEKPDLILLDLNIPGIPGLTLAETLSADHFPGKIIIITAYDKSRYVREAMNYGVVSYLLKPIDTKELKNTVDKCLRLSENRQPERKLESLLSYSSSYLVHDLLQHKVQEQVLQEVYGWPSDGALQMAFYAFSFATEEESFRPDQEVSLLSETEALYQNHFHLLSSIEEDILFVFLQPKTPMPESQLLLTHQINGEVLAGQWKAVSVYLSPISGTYSELLQLLDDFVASSETFPLPLSKYRNSGLRKKSLLGRGIILPADMQRYEKKFLQRFLERQDEQFIAYLKRKMENPETYWLWAAAFIQAFQEFDPEVDSRILLQIFQGEHALSVLEQWLIRYYREHPACEPAAEKDTVLSDRKQEQSASAHLEDRMPSGAKMDRALAIIQEQYSGELTQDQLAYEIGLTTTYFSYLFKKKTGKSFPQYLLELRMEHAIALMKSGELSVDSIAGQCGYYNKKYFLESFKKYTGTTFTKFKETLQTE